MIDIETIELQIQNQESLVSNLRPQIKKKILWAAKPNIKTKISLVFIHGFSATRAELSPVIEILSKMLKANVFFTRLKGHGQDGKSLGDASFTDWMKDTHEAIDIGKVLGDEIILIGSSTGCSLIHASLEGVNNIKAAVYVSPNFGSSSFLGKLLIIPGAKLFVPLFFGKEYSFVAKNSEHERCWTTSYPFKALFAVKDSVVAAQKVTHSSIKIPVMFWFSDADQVVSAAATRKIIAKMGDNASTHNPTLTTEDDSSKHGILGDILSASQTKKGVSKIINWITRI
jgi:esterase/lipase